MKKVFVVGIGPGGESGMTRAAFDAVSQADILVGYGAYIDLVHPLFPQKPTYQTGMTREVDRCREALRLAGEGRTVALVCSGDAGVYGMAGLTLELRAEYPGVEVEVIAGVTAALSGSAVLGAPLTHDFAVISLSDLLTPWEVIEKRLKCAAEGDFSIALYNPSSHKRADYLARACRILLACKAPETVCGYVQNIGREGERFVIVSLAQLESAAVDMFTTVFIGSSQTKLVDGRMVTPRGYHLD